MSALVPKVTRELTPVEAERCGNCDNCIHPLEEQIALPQRAVASF